MAEQEENFFAGFGRTLALGAVVGFVLVTAAVTVLAAGSGTDLGSAFGLAVFVGAFGGAGFGFTLAGSVAAVNALHREDEARRRL